MPKHISIPLGNMPVEFINVQPLNPLISECDIKILYHGKNRNRSYITKAVANTMANTLPNIPIVGEYLEHKEDFGDHAQEMIINNKGVKFIKRTVPYGLVPADTNIWWQWFHDDDGVDREYMLCKGYLWTGRYPEVSRVLDRGNGQSMELDLDSLKGEWAQFQNDPNEYFIVHEAIFSALCILGEDVEPCFQGANVTAPNNVMYSLNKDEFTAGMTQFMLDLKNALNSEEGGEKMPEDMNKQEGTEFENQEENLETENLGQTDENEPGVDANNNIESEFKADEDEKEEDEEFAAKEDEEEKEEENSCSDSDEEKEEEDEEEKKAKYNLEEVVEYAELKSDFDALQAKYDALVAEFETIKPELHSLREMKSAADKQAKEDMIAKFYMLDEADKKEVVDNINNYTVEEIESKLSVVAVRKKVNFNLDDTNKTETKTDTPIISFSAQTTDNVPAWLKAVEEVVKRSK